MHGPSFESANEANSFSKQANERLKHEASFNLRNLSKLVLPPLGASGYNQTQVESGGRIVSPMDSRYRCKQLHSQALNSQLHKQSSSYIVI